MPKVVFISPSKYVQGKGVLKEIGEYASEFGKKPLVVSDNVVWEITKNIVEDSFRTKIYHTNSLNLGRSFIK